MIGRRLPASDVRLPALAARPPRARAAKWIRRTLDIALVVVVAVPFALVLANQVAPAAGRQLFIIRTGSMEPTVPVGSLVVVNAASRSAIAPGDVISTRMGNGAVVTHRVVRVAQRDDGPHFETKGDANDHLDPALVPVDAVLGKVELALPNVGYLLALLSMPTGLFAVLCVAGSLLTAAALLEQGDETGAPDDAAREVSP